MDMFSVGDRVIGIMECDGNSLIIDVTGTVVSVEENGRYGIEYDIDIGGHNLDGTCESGHGWYTSFECLTAYAPTCLDVAVTMPYDEVMI